MINIVYYVIFVLLMLPAIGFGQNSGSPFGSSAENPGISTVGEVSALYDGQEEDWTVGLSSFELNVQAPIDPFGRADFTLHYHTELLDYDHDEHEHDTGGFD